MNNQVLSEGYRCSQNFYDSDLVLQHYLYSRMPASGLAYMDEKYRKLGALAATTMNPLSLAADKQGPVLRKRNFYGEAIDQIDFHPAYEQLTSIAVASEMLRLKWEPDLRARFAGQRHRLGFAAGFLFAMAEQGLFCPLCMTDGVALLIDRHLEEADKERLLAAIYTDQSEELYTGAMFLTEKAGGSDVGANLVTATHQSGTTWLLNGEKWFCSNAAAEIIFILARTDTDIAGTKGLGIFLIETKNKEQAATMELVRLKDKLGTRSMASGEYIFHNTPAQLVGQAQQGFKIMAEMINLSRLYNAVAAIAGWRRGLIEAYQFLSFRKSFGKEVLCHPMVRLKFEELTALYLGNFYSCWRTIELLDATETGNQEAEQLLRFLTPMVKKSTAEQAVYGLREAMELMGGMGYIEEGIIPKMIRDVMVLPIWEGAGNIMVLDMLRAAHKTEGLKLLKNELEAQWHEFALMDADFKEIAIHFNNLIDFINELMSSNQELMEANAKATFEQLTHYFHLGALIYHLDEDNEAWVKPAINYYKKILLPKKKLQAAISIETLKAMMGWSF